MNQELILAGVLAVAGVIGAKLFMDRRKVQQGQQIIAPVVVPIQPVMPGQPSPVQTPVMGEPLDGQFALMPIVAA